MSLVRTTLRQDETTDGTVTLTNRSNETVEVRHGEPCVDAFGLYRDGKLIGGYDDPVCVTSTDYFFLGPHQSHSWSFRLDARAPASHPGDSNRAPVDPGEYDATAGLRFVNSPGLHYAQEVVVTVTPS
jgi:hypothetical protein